MARARNIKPGFFKNYELADAGPTVQILFAGLWCLADREGRLEDKPRLIKAEIFPYYECDVNGGLTELQRLGFVDRYMANGVAVIGVCNFKKHQAPHSTEKASVLPANPQRDIKKPIESGTCETNAGLTVNPPKSNGGNPPDSLNPDSLNPDSLNPEEKTAPRKRSVPAPATPKPNDVTQQTWDDWLQLRKAKKAPVTATVLDQARTEAGKAGMTMQAFLSVWCARGSQGLDASWIKPHERTNGGTRPGKYAAAGATIFEGADHV